VNGQQALGQHALNSAVTECPCEVCCAQVDLLRTALGQSQIPQGRALARAAVCGRWAIGPLATVPVDLDCRCATYHVHLDVLTSVKGIYQLPRELAMTGQGADGSQEIGVDAVTFVVQVCEKELCSAPAATLLTVLFQTAPWTDKTAEDGKDNVHGTLNTGAHAALQLVGLLARRYARCHVHRLLAWLHAEVRSQQQFMSAVPQAPAPGEFQSGQVARPVAAQA